jgi:hypothetical protein
MDSPSTVLIMFLMKVQRNARKLAHIDDLWDMRGHKYLGGSSSSNPVTLNVVCSLRGKVAKYNKPAGSVINISFLLLYSGTLFPYSKKLSASQTSYSQLTRSSKCSLPFTQVTPTCSVKQ